MIDTLGINWGYLVIPIFIFGLYLILSLNALIALRRSLITGVSQVLWAILIVVVPVLGALAFFIVKPAENNRP